MPYNWRVLTFIETQLFTRLVKDCLSDEEYAAFQQELARNPEVGSVVKGSGGVRKVRWAAKGRGKSGGYRIIYLVRRPKGVIWLLTMYPKNVTDTIPSHVLKQIREEIGDD